MGRRFGRQWCDMGCGRFWAVLPEGRVRADPTWQPGPFISAHPRLATAWVLETILARESDKTHIRRIYYSASPEQEILS